MLLRGSTWAYPLVNTAHLLGIAMLLGSIVTLDLRLIGCWSKVQLQPLALVLQRSAMMGLCLAIPMGLLLFIARAADYCVNPVFLTKLILLLLAIVNALWLGRSMAWQLAVQGGRIRLSVRLAALVSLFLWLGVLLFGRLVGYR